MPLERRHFIPACLLILAGAAVYANSLSGPMLFDDQSAIVRNVQIRRLWPLSESLAAARDNALASRPFVNFSFAINYAIGGLSVRGYHVVNVGLHVVSALLLFGIIRRTLRTATIREPYGSASDSVALASAMIWMVHPLQTESVDYITQRTELMMGCCYLLTLYCAIRASADGGERWSAAAILSCLVGMGCKESMATAPLIVVLYDRVFLFDSFAAAWRRRKGLYAGLALGWLALAALLASSLPPTIGFGRRVSSWTYLLNQSTMIVRYLQLTFWPRGFVLDYGLPRSLSLLDVLPQLAIVTALLALTGVALVRKPAIGFLGAWFFITLAPASSVIPIMTEVGAERRMYLPLAGIVVFVVVAAVWGLAKVFRARWVPSAVVVGGVVIAGLAFATVRRNQDYASASRLLQTTVDRWPHGRAHFNLAVALREEGRLDEWNVHLRAAVPDHPPAQFELGSEYYDRGQFDDAIRQLQEFNQRIGPGRQAVSERVAALNLIALSLAQERRLPEAIEQFQIALQQDPDNPGLHGNLAFILLQSRDFEGARLHYEEFLRRQRGTAFVLTNLGIALQELGRSDEAASRFRQALAVDPRYLEARRRLERKP